MQPGPMHETFVVIRGGGTYAAEPDHNPAASIEAARALVYRDRIEYLVEGEGHVSRERFDEVVGPLFAQRDRKLDEFHSGLAREQERMILRRRREN